MRIYTRSGDAGTTGLIGGQRIAKDDLRMECIGTVDELNACLGLAACGAPATIEAMLRQIQNDLFNLGSHLALPGGDEAGTILPVFDETLVARLEGQIDSAERELPPLRQFILPGGCPTAAHLHLARTICRRAERRLVTFAAQHAVQPVAVIYLNRLGDWLFVQCRMANHLAGIEDVPWQKS